MTHQTKAGPSGIAPIYGELDNLQAKIQQMLPSTGLLRYASTRPDHRMWDMRKFPADQS